MKVYRGEINVKTSGEGDLIDLNGKIEEQIKKSGVKEGVLHLFAVDYNGHSHVRASIIGPSISIPIGDGKPILGTWQQVVLVELDTRPRSRKIVATVIGE
jgi:thiamine phosphate synthase YjbQ (UPF0047 family)